MILDGGGRRGEHESTQSGQIHFHVQLHFKLSTVMCIEGNSSDALQPYLLFSI